VIKLSMGSSSQSYGASPAVRDHTMLPATRHKWLFIRILFFKCALRFKVVQRSSMVIPSESSSAVLVIISSTSVPTCNRFFNPRLTIVLLAMY